MTKIILLALIALTLFACSGDNSDPIDSDLVSSSSYKKSCSSNYLAATQSNTSSDGGYSSSSIAVASSSSARSSSSVVQGDKCGTSSINYDKQFCYNDKVYTLCSGSQYDPESERCSGGALQYKCGKSSWYNEEKQFCLEDKVYSLCGGSSYDPAYEKCQSGAIVALNPSPSPSPTPTPTPTPSSSSYSSSSSKETKCGKNPQSYDQNVYECKPGINSNGIYLKQKPKDSQGNEYEAVLIGNQIWMAANLNYDDGDGSVGRCFEDNPVNCEKFGRMYILDEVECPDGWRLPSSEDLAKLLKYVDPSYKEDSEETGLGNNSAGKKLKSKSGWLPDYEGKDGNGTDDYGFNALPGGYCGAGCGVHEETGELTWSMLYPPVTGSAATPSSRANTSSFWWTTSKGTPVALAITWRISSGVAVDDAFQSYDTSRFYARCLKDK